MDYFTCGTIFVPHVFIHGCIHRVVLGCQHHIFTVRNSAHTLNVDVMRVFYINEMLYVQGVHCTHIEHVQMKFCCGACLMLFLRCMFGICEHYSFYA